LNTISVLHFRKEHFLAIIHVSLFAQQQEAQIFFLFIIFSEMNLIEVESGCYVISDMVDDHILCTLNLGPDNAFTMFSPTLRKVALARNLNDQQCINLLKEINPKNLTDDCLFQIRLVGGDESAKSNLYAIHLLKFLGHADPGDTFVIIGIHVHKHNHPESFAINCADGRVQPID
jgi:hypothetical protein